MKRLICSILAACAVLGFFWLGGFDFDTRGGMALLAGMYSLAGFALVYLCVQWGDE